MWQHPSHEEPGPEFTEMLACCLTQYWGQLQEVVFNFLELSYLRKYSVCGRAANSCDVDLHFYHTFSLEFYVRSLMRTEAGRKYVLLAMRME
jgi:hypothetical protein